MFFYVSFANKTVRIYFCLLNILWKKKETIEFEEGVLADKIGVKPSHSLVLCFEVENAEKCYLCGRE